MATREQLKSWSNRKPDCHFDVVELRPGYHRERISGAMDLYDKEYCNVTQLLPLDSFNDFLIHHLPDKNNKRMPNNVETTSSLHQKRMNAILSFNKDAKLWVDKSGVYNGAKMYLDEMDSGKTLDYDMTEYNNYINRGGMLPLTETEYEYYYYEENKEEAA